MMNYGLGNAMMQRDGAPHSPFGMQGLPQGMFGNMGPQFNPSLAAAMGLGQQPAPAQKKRRNFDPILGGLFGLLPGLLAGKM